MSFDIFLQAFKNGEPSVGDADAVKKLLSGVPHEWDDYGCCVISFPDDSSVDLYAGGLSGIERFDGAMFALHFFTDQVFRFVFDVADRGHFVMLPAMEGNPAIFTSAETKAGAPADLLEDFPPVIVRSGGELRSLISEGVERWQACRDQVLRSADGTENEAP